MASTRQTPSTSSTPFHAAREALVGEIAQSLENVLQNINKLNRSLEGVIAVGNEFGSVEALWSQFEGVMSARGRDGEEEEEEEEEEKEGQGGQGGGGGGGGGGGIGGGEGKAITDDNEDKKGKTEGGRVEPHGSKVAKT